jgi:hypothetical protein
MTKATDSAANAEGAFTTKLNSHEPKWLVTGGHQGKLSTTEDIGRERGELGLRTDSPGILAREFFELESCEPSIEIDDRANTYQLGILVSFKYRREDICYQINALLIRPAANKNKELSLQKSASTSTCLRVYVTFGSTFSPAHSCA